MLLLAWRRAFSFMFRDSRWPRKLLIGGLAILLFPPIGWPMALGYRKEVAFRLIGGEEPALPEWKGSWGRFVRDGFCATGIILVYYLPFLCLFWFLALDDVAVVRRHVLEIVCFLFAIPLLIPVSLPLLPPLYWYLFPWVHLTLPEMFVIGAVFWGTAFFMPAAFLQVSLTGRFLPAFRVARIVRFVLETPRAYLEAWVLSLLATALAFLVGPLAPWGIFWSYLVIVHAFNDALIHWRAPEVAERFRRSALHVAADAPGRRRTHG